MTINNLRMLYTLVLVFALSGCYRHPNLNGETIGSASGALAGGLAVASQAGGNLIFIGAGTVVGSIVGGVIGSAFDDMDRVHVVDPALWPIVVDCYQTRRPAYIVSYCPGIIVPPQNADMYQQLPWTDYPTLF